MNVLRRPFPTEWALLLLVCALGAALRFWRLDALPPGLYHDEGYYALDALKVIEGARPVYFPDNNGREPLFIYLLALSIRVLGRNPYAVRLPAAIVGALLIPAAYGLGRAMFNRRAALLGAAITAFTFYPVSLSRIGFRAGTLPLAAALAVSVTWVAFSRRDARWAALGGALYGLTLYTYLAARLTPLALGLFAAYFWLTGQARDWRDWSRWLLAFGGAALIVALPLLSYAFQFPEVFFKRSGELSIFSYDDYPQRLVQNIFAVPGMFWFTGDSFSRPRQNIPGRPFFDPVMGVFAAVGLVFCFHQLRRVPAGAEAKTGPRAGASAGAGASPAPMVLMLVWIGVMLLPTALTVEAPYFLRAVGILPFVSFLPALGLETTMRWLETRGRAGWGAVLAGLALLANFLITAHDYFATYAGDPHLYYSFEAAAASLADEISAAPEPAFVDKRYWDTYKSVEFLTRDPARMRLFEEGTPLAPTPGATVFIWPYEDASLTSLSVLPQGALISARAGPLFKNDFDAEPYSFYSVYTARPAPAGEPRAIFENGMGLQSAEVSRIPRGLRIEIIWAAGETPEGEYHVFAQAHDEEGGVLAQSDGIPAEGQYPTSWWRPGDFVEEIRELALDPATQPKLIIGLYNPVSGERLKLTSGADFVEINP